MKSSRRNYLEKKQYIFGLVKSFNISRTRSTEIEKKKKVYMGLISTKNKIVFKTTLWSGFLTAERKILQYILGPVVKINAIEIVEKIRYQNFQASDLVLRKRWHLKNTENVEAEDDLPPFVIAQLTNAKYWYKLWYQQCYYATLMQN